MKGKYIMNKRNRLIAGLCVAAMLVGCTGVLLEADKDNNGDSAREQISAPAETVIHKEERKEPEEEPAAEALPLRVIDDKYRTTYEIFVYSFADSNGDGIGDLRGVISNLDYINDGNDETDTDLGCNAIWLMPISPSPSYHKYDITDYKNIDPEYGSIDDFDDLVAECHERDIDVYLDLVINHTSNEHPWFQDASDYLKEHQDPAQILDEEGKFTREALEECPYLDYYNFSDKARDGYERVNGTEWYYEARFWSGMPDLNLDSDRVFEEIEGITKFWSVRGVDGYRLDAVTSYFTKDIEKNTQFLTRLNAMIKSQNPKAYIVGEAWTSEAEYAEYYKSGIDSFFAFHYANGEGMIARLAKSKMNAAAFADELSNSEKLFHASNPDYVDAPFYTNHDMARSAGYYTGRGADSSVKLAGGLNLLMGGNAFIYYGEELGMRGSGKDENKRAPMYWVNEAGSGAQYDKLAANMCQGPKDMDEIPMSNPPYYVQKDDEYSIYNYYKNAIRMRNTFPVIARGVTTPVPEIETERLGAFIRAVPVDTVDKETFGPNSVLIVFNNSSDEITVNLGRSAAAVDYNKIVYQLNTSAGISALDRTELTVAPFGIVVLDKQ